MRIMIHRGSTGKVLLTRGPLFYQTERSREERCCHFTFSYKAALQIVQTRLHLLLSESVQVLQSESARSENVRGWWVKMYRAHSTTERCENSNQLNMRNRGSCQTLQLHAQERRLHSYVLLQTNLERYSVVRKHHFTGTLYIDFTLRVSNM